MGRTIAAISTALGEGAISVIRLSGDTAIETADKIFRALSGKRLSDASGYTAHFGKVVYDGEEIDETVVTVFRAPKSYTGEDVVELSVHGGVAAARLTLRAALNAGAYPAEAGEFTRRAVMSGKMNLSEAESVMGIISAQSEYDLKMQFKAKSGAVSGAVAKIRDRLISLAGDIAAYSDFPDEDLKGLSVEEISDKIRAAVLEVDTLVRSFDIGSVLHNGVRTAIVGAPNSGKSTLMNMLCGNERSIVTDIAGTTRDVIEQTVMLGNIPLVLFDTAGIRSTSDTVEEAGIKRAEECMENAQLILAVFDGSKELSNGDREFIKRLDKTRTIAVVNKSDLALCDNDYSPFEAVVISAKTEDGKDSLQKAIEEFTGTAHLDPNAAVLSTARQRDCAAEALSALKNASKCLADGFTVDAAGVLIDEALSAMLRLTGDSVSDTVADDVFSRFCIGK